VPRRVAVAPGLLAGALFAESDSTLADALIEGPVAREVSDMPRRISGSTSSDEGSVRVGIWSRPAGGDGQGELVESVGAVEGGEPMESAPAPKSNNSAP
jgi:hypothetical protein